MKTRVLLAFACRAYLPFAPSFVALFLSNVLDSVPLVPLGAIFAVLFLITFPAGIVAANLLLTGLAENKGVVGPSLFVTPVRVCGKVLAPCLDLLLRYWKWVFTQPCADPGDFLINAFLFFLVPLPAVGLLLMLSAGAGAALLAGVVGCLGTFGGIPFMAAHLVIWSGILLHRQALRTFEKEVWPDVARAEARRRVTAFYRQHPALSAIYPEPLFDSMVDSVLPEGDVGATWTATRDLLTQLHDVAEQQRERAAREAAARATPPPLPPPPPPPRRRINPDDV